MSEEQKKDMIRQVLMAFEHYIYTIVKFDEMPSHLIMDEAREAFIKKLEEAKQLV